jgi:hypothetical protein
MENGMKYLGSEIQQRKLLTIALRPGNGQRTQCATAMTFHPRHDSGRPSEFDAREPLLHFHDVSGLSGVIVRASG